MYIFELIAQVFKKKEKSAPDENSRPTILMVKTTPLPKSGCNIIKRKAVIVTDNMGIIVLKVYLISSWLLAQYLDVKIIKMTFR